MTLIEKQADAQRMKQMHNVNTYSSFQFIPGVQPVVFFSGCDIFNCATSVVGQRVVSNLLSIRCLYVSDS